VSSKRFVSVGECMIEMSGGEGGQYSLGFAGDTLNTAWYAKALLGPDWQVDYVSAVGDDRYSAQMLDFFEQNGIGTQFIAHVPGRRPGLYVIHQEGGDRHFTYWREASAARFLAEDRDRLDVAFAGADILYFSGITLAILMPRARGRLLKALVTARDRGARLAFDPNIRPALWSSTRTMGSVLIAAASVSDIILPTHGDEADLFGDADCGATADRYLGLGAEEVVVKNGAGAAIAATASDRHEITPLPGPAVVDPTGAGDSFNGAYLAARAAGHGLREATEMAHRVAGMVIGQPGALVDAAVLNKEAELI
jgi:2-dehydro-3-deoxygluconokinase